MKQTPAIDYALLGRAVAVYIEAGYTYVEVPWAVDDEFIAATLPDRIRTLLTEMRGDQCTFSATLIGSAEQGFLAMDLPPGQYVACTPCFRSEECYNDFYQRWFMKVELFDNRPGADGYEMMEDAHVFMQAYSDHTVVSIKTEDGYDLTINGIEVGSYGNRTTEKYGSWAYGTGLALPRFSVSAGRELHLAIR